MHQTRRLKNKVKCETCNKEVNESLYENHLRTYTHINNLKNVNAGWKKCETFNFDIWSPICDNPKKSNEQTVGIAEGHYGTQLVTVPSLKELVVGTVQDNN